jgi:hypothetical protein
MSKDFVDVFRSDNLFGTKIKFDSHMKILDKTNCPQAPKLNGEPTERLTGIGWKDISKLFQETKQTLQSQFVQKKKKEKRGLVSILNHHRSPVSLRTLRTRLPLSKLNLTRLSSDSAPFLAEPPDFLP